MILWGVKYGTDIDEYYKTMLPRIEKNKEAYIKKRLKEITEFANSN